MENNLLRSLREITDDNINNQSIDAQYVDYSRATNFASLPDYDKYQSMRSAFEPDGMFSNCYFLPRSGLMDAQIDTPHGEKILFSGYNYLGLANDPRVLRAAKDAIDTYGCHAGAARMVGGEIELHGKLERALAEFTDQEDAVVGVGGYSANVSVISYLLGNNDLLVHDSYMHNSGVMGGVQSGARRISFPHNDYDALDRILLENRDRAYRVMILVEGAYSMDGDVADLPRLLEIKNRYNCWLMVDEAHSIGTLGATGRGLAEHWGVNAREIDIVMGTLSKSFGSCGGFISGCQELISLLRIYAPGLLLFSTGISPANTAAALASLEVMVAEPERVIRLQDNARFFFEEARRRGMDVGSASGLAPIVPIVIGADLKSVSIASELFESGILAHPIIYPAVPQDASRIRFFITAMHERSQITQTLDFLEAQIQVQTSD